MMGYAASIICAVITLGMALLQLSLTFGAPFGEYALGGMNRVLPPKTRFVSCTFSLMFIFIGTVYLQRAGVLSIGLSPAAVRIVIMINTLFLAYAIIGNGKLTKSKKEKYVMTPLSIIQFVLSVLTFFFA